MTTSSFPTYGALVSINHIYVSGEAVMAIGLAMTAHSVLPFQQASILTLVMPVDSQDIRFEVGAPSELVGYRTLSERELAVVVSSFTAFITEAVLDPPPPPPPPENMG